MIFDVEISALAKKQLKKVPGHIVVKLMSWVDSVANEGLEETRKIKGYHDEPLKGERKGQRSIRLSLAYRAIYEVRKSKVEFVQILEVSKHDY